MGWEEVPYYILWPPWSGFLLCPTKAPGHFMRFLFPLRSTQAPVSQDQFWYPQIITQTRENGGFPPHSHNLNSLHLFNPSTPSLASKLLSHIAVDW